MTNMELTHVLKKIKTVAEAPIFNREEYLALEKTIVAAGLCPSCNVNESKRVKLMAWIPGNIEEYAGRECPLCEDFFRCGEQMEYNTEPDCFSDADPGL